MGNPYKEYSNDYWIKGDTAIFSVCNRKNEKVCTFIVDADRAHQVSKYPWRLDGDGYIRATCHDRPKRKYVFLHWLILGLTDDDVDEGIKVDHINRDMTDNRLANLRKCSHAENMKNKRTQSNNKFGVSGVKKRPSGSYTADITIDGKRYLLITTEIQKEAEYARWIAERKVHSYRFRDKDYVDHEFPDIPDERKREIMKQVSRRLKEGYASRGKSRFIGVSLSHKRWLPRVYTKEAGTVCLPMSDDQRKAVYARFVAEEMNDQIMKASPDHEKKREYSKSLSKEDKEKITSSVTKKLKSAGLIEGS